jgi:hypothetical protein
VIDAVCAPAVQEQRRPVFYSDVIQLRLDLRDSRQLDLKFRDQFGNLGGESSDLVGVVLTGGAAWSRWPDATRCASAAPRPTQATFAAQTRGRALFHRSALRPHDLTCSTRRAA